MRIATTDGTAVEKAEYCGYCSLSTGTTHQSFCPMFDQNTAVSLKAHFIWPTPAFLLELQPCDREVKREMYDFLDED